MIWQTREMMTRLAHVTIYVRDEDEALSFYTEKLGLEKRADVNAGPGDALVDGGPGGADGGGNRAPQAAGLARVKDRRKLEERIGQGTIWVFNTDDCRKAHSTLKSRGVRFLSTPEERPYGLEAIFEDLYGNVFSLLEPRLS